MQNPVITFGITIWIISLLGSFLFWILFIRPYIRKNGRSTGNGANYGWAAIADASIADEIAKKNKKTPWFLRVFWLLVLIEFGIPIIGMALAYFNQ